MTVFVLVRPMIKGVITRLTPPALSAELKKVAAGKKNDPMLFKRLSQPEVEKREGA